MSGKGVTEAEYRLIYALKDSGINKDDALVIVLIARKYDIAKEIIAWIETHDKPTWGDIIDYIYSELVDVKVEVVDDE